MAKNTIPATERIRTLRQKLERSSTKRRAAELAVEQKVLHWRERQSTAEAARDAAQLRADQAAHQATAARERGVALLEIEQSRERSAQADLRAAERALIESRARMAYGDDWESNAADWEVASD